MKIEQGLRCNNCQALDLVDVEGQDRCRICGSLGVELYDLPPKPSRAKHLEAYRRRAGMVGELLSCICTYPMDVDASTVSGHDARCPSDAMSRARIEREERVDSIEEQLPPWER